MNTINRLIRKYDKEGVNYLVQSELNDFGRKNISKYFSVKYVVNGTEYYKIDGKEYLLKENNFLIVHPDQEIEVQIDSGLSTKGICYYFDSRIIHQLWNSNLNSIDANLDNFDSSFNTFSSTFSKLYNIPVNKFLTRFNNLFQNSHSDQSEISEYLILIAEHMVAYQYQCHDQLDNLSSIKSTTKQELHKRIQSGRQFIHDNISRPISLSEIAKAACLSEYYFHRTFRKYFNLTPQKYHDMIRMQLAHDLICQDKYDRDEVADRCGFQDSKYFSKTYNKWAKLQNH